MKSDGRKEEGRIWIRSSLLPQAKLPSRRPRSAARAPQAFLILCLPVRPARGLGDGEAAGRIGLSLGVDLGAFRGLPECGHRRAPTFD